MIRINKLEQCPPSSISIDIDRHREPVSRCNLVTTPTHCTLLTLIYLEYGLDSSTPISPSITITNI